jgi:hypothetical protein
MDDNNTIAVKEDQTKTYLSQDVLSNELDIPKGLLRLAKKSGCPGFEASGRIHWDVAEPWFNQHRVELEDELEDNLLKWKTRKTKAEAITAEMELEELKEKYVDKEEAKAFLKQIASATKAVLKSKLTQELPPRLLGLGITEMSLVMDSVVQEICNLFQAPIDKWK